MAPELAPPISLENQRRIWGLAQRITSHLDVCEASPVMNNLPVLLPHPQLTALDAIERLQWWWEESESVLPDARPIAIPVIYGGDADPNLAQLVEHAGMTPRQVAECHAGADYIVCFLVF